MKLLKINGIAPILHLFKLLLIDYKENGFFCRIIYLKFTKYIVQILKCLTNVIFNIKIVSEGYS